MRDKPFSFQALGENLKSTQIARDDRDRFWASSKTLSWSPLLWINGVGNQGGFFGDPNRDFNQGVYVRQNDLVTFWFYANTDESTAGAGTDQWYIDLPTPSSVRTSRGISNGPSLCADISMKFGANHWTGEGKVDDGKLYFQVKTAINTISNVASGTPVALADGIQFTGWGSYEAASGYNA